jgi:hypothetical protein
VLLDPAGEGCFCEQAITCEEERLGAGIGLRTALCPGEPFCRACEPFPVAACSIAPRTEGTTRVCINGVDALELDVLAPDVLPEPVDVCVRTAQIDSCGATWAPQVVASDWACHLDTATTGTRVPIRVFDPCGNCKQIGPCSVTVADGLITVEPAWLPNSCEIACDDSCEEVEHLCVTPPLRDGTYTVLVAGLSGPDDGPPSTITVSPDPGPASLACRGAR